MGDVERFVAVPLRISWYLQRGPAQCRATRAQSLVVRLSGTHRIVDVEAVDELVGGVRPRATSPSSSSAPLAPVIERKSLGTLRSHSGCFGDNAMNRRERIRVERLGIEGPGEKEEVPISALYSGDVVIALVHIPSILMQSTGNCRRQARKENPVMKSSTAIFTPREPARRVVGGGNIGRLRFSNERYD